MRSVRRMIPAVALAGTLLAGPSAVSAQVGRSSFAVTLGPSRYDLSGSGTVLVGAVHFDLPMNAYLIVEPGFTYFSYRADFGQRISFLFPEIGVQVQGYAGPFRPFLGGGPGLTTYTRGPNTSEFTLHAVAGTRVVLTRSWGLRLELRIRSVDPFHGNTTRDLTFGISHSSGGPQGGFGGAR